MGFDFRKAISKFSSSKPQKLERTGVKREEKVSSSSSTTTTTTATTIVTHQARRVKRKDGKVVKSVKFVDCDCDRNVKVAPFTVDSSSSSSATTTTATKSVIPSSAPQPTPPPPCSSSADSRRRRSFERNLIPISLPPPEDPPVPKSPNSSLGSIVPAENQDKPQIRFPSPRGLHSRNLSYGTIYNASKAASREHSPCPRDDRSNAKPTVTPDKVNDNQPTTTSTKPTRSIQHVFGLGGCNYGHGSIINGVKSLKSVKANNNNTNDSGLTSTKVEPGKGKQDPLGSSSEPCGAYVVEELKKMGNEEYRKGQFQKALSLYDRAIKLDPCNAPCHLNKAASLANLGRIREALEECLQAIGFDPSYSRAHYRLGMLYTRLGHIEDAKKHFQLSGHSQNSEGTRRMLAVEGCLMSMRRALKMEDWQRVLVESSRSLDAGADACDEALAAKAEALLKLHRAHEALEILMATKSTEDGKLPRGCLRLLLLEAQTYLYLGRFDEGVRAAEEAVYTEFNKDSLLQLKKAWGAADAYKAGNEYYNIGRLSEACAMYAQGLQYIPTNPSLLCRRATCRMKTAGQMEGAIDDLNTVLKSNPNHSEAFILRAQALTKIGRGDGSQRESVVTRKWK